MIASIWHGWSTHANADAFEALVKNEICPALLARGVTGFRSSQLLRLARTGQTEFICIGCFDDMDAVRALLGDDVDAKPMLPPKALALLRRFDQRTQHFEVRETTGA